MNTFAVVAISGTQYKVEPGQEIIVPLLVGAPGDKIDLDQVLLFSEEGKVTIGSPSVPGKKLTAIIVSQDKGPKIKVSKYKAKSRYQKEIGFRSKLTKIKIENFGTTAPVPKPSPKRKNPKAKSS